MKRLSTSVVSASLAGLTTTRSYTHAPIGCSNRYNQAYQAGDVMPKALSKGNAVSADGIRMTGSNVTDSFSDISDLFSVQRMAKDTSFFVDRHNARYAVNPLSQEQVEVAAAVLSEFRSNEAAVSSFFKRVIKSYPSTVYIMGSEEEIAAFDDHEDRKTPYNKLIVGRVNRDAGAVNIREDLLTLYSDIFAVLADEAAVKKIASPVVEKFRYESFVSPYLWWEFKVAFLAELEDLPGMNNYKRRLTTLAIERATKIALNTDADQPWATESLTDPMTVSVGTLRGQHEAGMW